MFDIPPAARSREQWEVSLPLEEHPWHIGCIVGPSGCGKSTIARELFGAHLCQPYAWSATHSILDGFPAPMGIKEITQLLSSVGFSSPPLWLRPFHVLSTGQQMRVTVARLLAEQPALAVMDEFTSVVDRTVAQIGSAAIAKTVRKRGQQFIAVTCHEDVLDWLQPDWVYQPHSNTFSWRDLQQRPAVTCTVRRVHHSCWPVFRPYHYLNQSFAKNARCFVAFLGDQPVALQAVLPTPHAQVKRLYRGHRAVCLPDYQGIGIGNALITYIASAYRGIGARITSTTASPALIASRTDDPRWRCIRTPGLANTVGLSSQAPRQLNTAHAVNRLTSTWEYIGPALAAPDARALLYD